MNLYWITLRGQVDVREANASSPHQMTPIAMQAGNTTITICTDQSGLIGLVRHLHNLGFDIVSIVCKKEKKDT